MLDRKYSSVTTESQKYIFRCLEITIIYYTFKIQRKVYWRLLIMDYVKINRKKKKTFFEIEEKWQNLE